MMLSITTGEGKTTPRWSRTRISDLEAEAAGGALALAGGPAEFADMGNVRILRKSGGGLAVIPVRLSDVLKGNPSSRDLGGLPQIESGDTVIVP